MLPEHLLASVLFSSILFWYVSDDVHAGTQLINHQITQHHQIIISNEFFHFLDALFEFFDFLGHLLANSDSVVDGD